MSIEKSVCMPQETQSEILKSEAFLHDWKCDQDIAHVICCASIDTCLYDIKQYCAMLRTDSLLLDIIDYISNLLQSKVLIHIYIYIHIISTVTCSCLAMPFRPSGSFKDKAFVLGPFRRNFLVAKPPVGWLLLQQR